MIPKQIFNPRRGHRNMPPMLSLTITNYIVAILLFTTINATSWFFYVVLACLAWYNFYTIRRNRDEIIRINIIAYAIGWAGIVLLFFVTRNM